MEGTAMNTDLSDWRRVFRGGVRLYCALSLLGASTAFAQWMDGANLARVCDPAQKGHFFRPGVCSGYIMAAIDLDEVLTTRGLISKPLCLCCMPEDVSMMRVNAVVTGFLKAHPERLGDSAALLVIDALNTEFPCKH
jgi:Rap1a immunity proteins